MALVANYGSDSDMSDEEMEVSDAKTTNDNSDDVLEDFVKKTNYGNVSLEKPPPKLMATAGLAKLKTLSAKGKIQISVPALLDSDSEGEEPTPKKQKSFSGATGFLGCLPAPRNCGGKESGRKFIPHTLTKSAPSASKPSASKLPISQSVSRGSTVMKSAALTTSSVNKGTAEYSSDSEEEAEPAQLSAPPTNFFSLDSEPVSHSAHTGAVTDPTLANGAFHNESLPDQKPAARLTAASLYNMTDGVSGGANWEDDTGGGANWGDDTPLTAVREDEANDVHHLLNDKEFLKLQGKKGRGKEAIEFIDIHSNDQKISEIELTKNISEEVDPAAFAHRKKGEGPSSQQKRKHQITYLAFQAKERELELKNTWAANKATRQQTQAKYGF